MPKLCPNDKHVWEQIDPCYERCKVCKTWFPCRTDCTHKDCQDTRDGLGHEHDVNLPGWAKKKRKPKPEKPEGEEDDMAKIDDTFTAIGQGFQNPSVALYQTMLEDKQMEQFHIRRKQTGVTHHQVWAICVGEMGQQPTAMFFGHKPSDCIKKALEWRGLPTKSRTGKNGAQATAG